MTDNLPAFRRALVPLLLASMLPVVEADGSWVLFGVIVAGSVLAEALYLLRRQRPVSASLVRFAALLSVGYLFFEFFLFAHPVPAITALAHFLMLLACCKFFECATHRDLGLLLIIGLLLLVVGSLVSGSVVYAVVLILGLSLGVGWLIAYHRDRERRAIESRCGPAFPVPPEPVLDWQRPAASAGASGGLGGANRSGSSGRLIGPVAAVSAVLVVTASVAFVVVPRGLSRQIFGRLHPPVPAAVTGYSEEVRLESDGVVASEQAVMRVRVTRGGEAIGSDGAPLYLRGRTHSRYEGGRWAPRPSAHLWCVDPISLDEPRTLSAAAHRLPSGQLLTQEVWLERGAGPYLFAVHPVLAVAGAADVGRVDQDCDDLSLRSARYSGRAMRYRVVSAAGPAPQLAALLESEHLDRTDPRSSARLLRGGVSERVAQHRPERFPTTLMIPRAVSALARRIAESIGDPRDEAHHAAIAQAFCDFLKEGDFVYTLEPVPARRSVDRIQRFLLETRRGHCEFFASALTLLCQAVGIPARLASGYLATEYNSVGSFYLVRRRDAHAWCEVRLPGLGWVALDPSPTAQRQPGRDSLRATLANLVDFLQFEWVTFVVSFDSDIRRRLFGSFEGWFRRIDESRGRLRFASEVAVALLRGPPELTAVQRLLYWVMLGLVVLMGALVLRVLFLLWLRLRERMPRRAPGGPPVRRSPAARFYDRLLVALARRGFDKPPHLTPREFARHVATAGPALRPLVDITEWYYQVQYGGRSLDRPRLAVLNAFLLFLRGEADPGSTHDT